MYKFRMIGVAVAAGLVLAGGHSHAAQTAKPTHPAPAHRAHHVAQVKRAGQPGWSRYIPQPDQHITKAPGVKDTTHM